MCIRVVVAMVVHINNYKFTVEFAKLLETGSNTMKYVNGRKG